METLSAQPSLSLFVNVKVNQEIPQNSIVSFCFRGVGCIFFEMASGRPLFPGSTVEDQLQLIFSLLGKDSSVAFPTLLLCI